MLALCSATVVAAVYGFGPVPARAADKWWLAPDVQRALGLTQPQVVELNKIFETTFGERVRLRKQLDRLEADFARAMSSDDDDRVTRLVGRVEAARAARNIARTMMLVRMYRILTPDQRRRLDSRAFLERFGSLSERH